MSTTLFDVISNTDLMSLMWLYLSSKDKRLARSICKSSCTAIDENVKQLTIKKSIQSNTLNKWHRVEKMHLIDVKTLPNLHDLTRLTTLIIVSLYYTDKLMHVV